ncbi:Beta-lactamase domain-containing protein 2 [Colletotrichum sp. SAR11_59]|nr:Beta-lactamase domain-containing protein 2 [Colletotrichum sp. SAR11_59]
MAEIQGTCDPRFEELRTHLKQLVDSGEEVGAAIAVNLDGQDVVDIWGGYADKENNQPWNRDTIVNIFSTTKNVLSLAILILIDRKNIEIRHILSHTSGVSGWDADRPLSFEEISNLDEANAKLAAQAPWWTPGSASGYHTWTFGHLLGEIVRRATGKALQEFLMEEIVAPLGADFQFGVAERDLPRTSDVIPAPLPKLPPGVGPQPGSITLRTMNPMPFPSHFANGASWRQGHVLSASGHTNARALARILSAISLGGSVDGKRFLAEETIAKIFEEQSNGVDLVTNMPLRFGIGYGITGDGNTAVAEWLPNGRVCFWGGMGGSFAVMDLDRKLTITYVMNKMSMTGLGNDAFKKYPKIVYKASDQA